VFKSSALELKKLPTITITALMVALHTALSLFSFYITESSRVSISFITNCIVGWLFGPMVSLISGALGDVVQYLAKPTGPYFPGFTFSAGLAGNAYGVAFYKKAGMSASGKEDNVNKDASNIRNVSNVKNASNTTNASSIKRICLIISQALTLAAIAAWFFSPIMTLRDGDGTIIRKASAIDILAEMGYHGRVSACIIALIIIVALCLLLMTNLLRQKLVPIQIALYTACIVGIATYSDKKVIDMELGFAIMIICMVLIALVNVIDLLHRKGIDLKLLLTCFIVMSFVAVFVNGLLGTYWISVIQGRGFLIYFASRMIKNLLQLPINTVFAYIVIMELSKIKKYIIRN